MAGLLNRASFGLHPETSAPPGPAETMGAYFADLDSRLEPLLRVAREARGRGLDPSPDVEIPVARDLADRVESLVGVEGVASALRRVEAGGKGRQMAAFLVAREIARGALGGLVSPLERVEAAVRTGLAILTEGVVAAPIDGIAGVKEERNGDGTRYVRVLYAGPIRSAGGTEQALSLLIADDARRAAGYGAYVPTEAEVERYVEEVFLYKQVMSLQYTPSEEEVRAIARHCPVCIDGEPTEDVEVERNRGLKRVDSNRVRGGMALVLADGLASKAPKLRGFLSNPEFARDVGLEGWGWLGALGEQKTAEDLDSKVKPSDKYLRDLVAGRPVLSHPSRMGGFRLRYGRARNTGLAAVGIHPATMVLLDDFVAPGTQLKVERPGKGACAAPVDSIEGPYVRTMDGVFLQVRDPEAARELRPRVEHIIDVGEILVSYGDFLENNHPLMPGAYGEERWTQEVEKHLNATPAGVALAKAGEGHMVPRLSDGAGAVAFARETRTPLHPRWTYLWHDLTLEQFQTLARRVSGEGNLEGGVLRLPGDLAGLLEALLVEHRREGNRLVVEDPMALVACLGLDEHLSARGDAGEAQDGWEAAQSASGLVLRKRAPTRIGLRVGRPEKSRPRKMKPPVHGLFPLGEAGGRGRLLHQAAQKGKVEVEMGWRVCPECRREGTETQCPCGARRKKLHRCPRCQSTFLPETCPRCRIPAQTSHKRLLPLGEMYARALQRLGETPPAPGNGHGRPKERLPRESTLEEEEGDGGGSAEGPAGGLHYLEKVKGVQGLISRERVPEPLEKGILRARHDVSIFKDGTIRFDMTNLPLTHFRPREAGVPPETLRGLGYTHDTEGRPLEEPDQLLELRPQDILLSASAGDYLVRVAGFIDDLLEKHYGLPPAYRVRRREDLVGHLAIGLAPHTSAGVLVRIAGYTPLAASLAHPFFHSAKRRNADGDEDSVILLLDGLLNFSRAYLPASRGGSMDAPLVLTLHIDPQEIDDEAHNLDVGSLYPLEFYEAAERMAAPQEVAHRMDLVKHRLGTPGQYLGFHTTHPIARLDQGPHHSAYTQLASMDDKLTAELALARRLRAVDPRDVAERVLNNHLLRDLMGNLRQFSQQSFRCSLCNAKYRRPPLRGLCHRCGVPIHLTVHAASVRKYLQMSQRIAREYQVSDYISQRLRLIEREIDSLFTPAASRREAAGGTGGDPAAGETGAPPVAAGTDNGKRNGGNGGAGGQMGLGDFL